MDPATAARAADLRGAERAVLSLVLPAYNEARRLPASLARCAAHFRGRGMPAEIIVADDGSTDGTATVYGDTVPGIESAAVTFRYLPLRHRGKGAAVRAGVLHAAGDPIVTLDADLTIPVETVDRFIEALDRGADIAVASRYVHGARVRRPLWRRVSGVTYRAAVHALVPVDVRDTQCGGKAYTAEAAKQLFARQRLDGYAFDAEVLFLARRAGYRVEEVAVAVEQDGDTRIVLLADAPRMLRDLVRIRANALTGKYR